MPKKVAISTLNASTVDILNVIRQNASQQYQDLVPEVTSANDIPRVGEVLMGYPALANDFLSALMNRIAYVVVRSATFNNPYRDLKKGYIEFGETIEEIFVNIAKVRTFSYDKAAARELKRTMPDVKTAFHAMNWNVQYPITINESDLQKAFMSMEGVRDLIARVVDSIYKAHEYDEYLLFKYLLIQAVTKGQMKPITIGDGTDLKEAATAFRGTSNQLTFMSSEYNTAGVKNNTPRERQVIFMDAEFNARFDVEVLAAAFNMEKADFMGRLYLIDSWDTFDNERFEEIREESDMLGEVTAEQLNLMKNVHAVLVDEDWFQVYDLLAKFTETFVAAGDYWNYFYRVQKTISYSPYANATAFVSDGATVVAPESLTLKIASKDASDTATVFTLDTTPANSALVGGDVRLVQSEDATEKGIAIIPAGGVIFPKGQTETTLEAMAAGQKYTATTALNTEATPGATITLNKG